MGLWTPQNEFQSYLTNVTGQPANSMGVSITPAENSKGSYTEIVDAAALTFDAHFIEIHITDNAVSGQIKDALVDIAVDPTDSSSFSTIIIPDLCVPGCGNWTGGSSGGAGFIFRFPLFIAAGTQIGARASTNNVTVGTINVTARLWGRPKYPHLCKTGSYVTAFGVNTAASNGTTVAEGTTSEGAWIDVSGGANTTLPYWWWEYGMGVGDSSTLDNIMAVDIGVSADGTNFDTVIEDSVVVSTSSENAYRHQHYSGIREVPAGIRPYARIQSENGLGDDATIVVYGLGG